MKHIPYLHIAFFWLQFSTAIVGQPLTEVRDPESFARVVKSEYGRDQNLVNGTQLYTPYRINRGHPYFIDPNFKQGYVIIKGQRYDDVRLRYNIDGQNIELEYKTIYGINSYLMPVKDFIDGFSIGGITFQKMEIKENQPEFYQVISTDHFNLYVFWENEPQVSSNTSEGMVYSQADQLYYLEDNYGEIMGITGARGFYKAFPHMKKKIRRSFREAHFYFRDATPPEIIHTMTRLSLLMDEMDAQ